MTKAVFSCMITLLSYGCFQKISSTGLKEGKVRSKVEFISFTDTSFGKELSNLIVTSHKWYKKHLVIDEKIVSRFRTEHGKTVESLVTMGYVFMDYKKKIGTEYATFSDTAHPVQTFYLYDTVKLAGGSYHWGAAKSDTSELSRNVVMLPDSTIGNIVYKRAMRLYKKTKEKPKDWVQIYYFRPDVSEDLSRLYFWDDSLTRAVKAPIVQIEDRFSPDSPVALSRISLAFLADSLTAEQKRVFAAWEKNERSKR